MRRTNTLVLSLTLAGLLAGCTDARGGAESSDSAWYRAEQESEDVWLIARADPATGSCHVLKLNSFAAPASALEDVDVNVDGIHVGPLFEVDDPRGCQTREEGADPLFDASGFGQVRFEQSSVLNGLISACRLDVDVTATGVRFVANDLYIWNSGEDCSPQPSDTTYYSNLEAAFTSETSALVIAGWDPLNETCAWIELYADVIVAHPSGLELPDPWYIGLSRIALMTEDQCDAASLGAENFVGSWTDLGRDEVGDGTVAFTDSEIISIDGVDVELPCTLSIDAWVPFFATHYWVPARAGFVASALPVAGACS